MGCHPQQFQYEATTCVVTHHSTLPFTGMNLVWILVAGALFILAGAVFYRIAR